MGNIRRRIGKNFNINMEEINRRLNDFLRENGIPKQLNFAETTDLLFTDSSVTIKPEDLIRKGSKGRRLLFSGEIKL